MFDIVDVSKTRLQSSLTLVAPYEMRGITKKAKLLLARSSVCIHLDIGYSVPCHAVASGEGGLDIGYCKKKGSQDKNVYISFIYKDLGAGSACKTFDRTRNSKGKK